MSENIKREVMICRACLNECLDYKSLYKQGLILGEITTLGALMNFCTSLVMDVDDTLPAQLCTSCVKKLARTYAFKKTVLESNEVLLKQHVESYESSNTELIVDDGEEATDDGHQQQEQRYVEEEVGAEELQELANAAQMHRTMDNVEYMTLTYLDAANDERTITLETVVEEAVKSGVALHEDDECEGVALHVISEAAEVYAGDEGTFMAEESAETELEVDDKTFENFEEVTWNEESNDDAMSEDNDDDDMHEESVIALASLNAQSAAESKPTEQDASTSDVTALTEEQPREEPHQPMQFEPPKMKVTRTRRRSSDAKSANCDLKCKICSKQLSNSSSYKYHMQLHSEDTPYLCSLCGESFKTRNAYEGHSVIHNPNNPNTCEKCGKAYRQASSLRTHMLSHSGEKPYRCEICGKGMTQKSGYKKHLLTHTGEMPHSCDICGRAFRYSSNLLAHKRWHTGEKPYQCDQCKRRFPTAEQRKRHCLVHSGERPFSCPVCLKAFKRRSALASHHQIHAQQLQQQANDKSDNSNNLIRTDGMVEKTAYKSKVVQLC